MPLHQEICCNIMIALLSVCFVLLFSSYSVGITNISGNSDISVSKIFSTSITDKPKGGSISLYEAYYSETKMAMQRRRNSSSKRQHKFVYDPHVLNQSVINNEYVAICGDKYLVTLSSAVLCNDNHNEIQTCHWESEFKIYALPAVSQNAYQKVSLQGQILLSNSPSKNRLLCESNKDYWTINYAFQKSMEWELQSLVLRQTDCDACIVDFQIKRSQLQINNHRPKTFHINEGFVVYCTEEEPWLIRYGFFEKSSLLTINILSQDIQQLISNGKDQNNQNGRKIISIHSVFIFASTFFREEQKSSLFITCIYQSHRQLHYQLTFQLYQNIFMEPHVVSYSLLFDTTKTSEEDPFHCKLSTHNYDVYPSYSVKNGFEKNRQATLQKHTLLCVFRQNLDQQLKIVKIDNLLGLKSDFKANGLVLRRAQFRNGKRIISINEIKPAKYEQTSRYFSDWPQQIKILADLLSDESSHQIEEDWSLWDDSSLDDYASVENSQQYPTKDRSLEYLQEINEEFLNMFQRISVELAVQSFIFTNDIYGNIEYIEILSGDPLSPIIYLKAGEDYLLILPLQKEKNDQTNEQQNQEVLFFIDSQELVDSETARKYEDQKEIQMMFRGEIESQIKQILKIKAMSIQDSIFDNRNPGLQGLVKPYRKQVIIACGYGIKVYELNWDTRKKMLYHFSKQQITKVQQSNGIQVASLMPFLFMFATISCITRCCIKQ